MAQNDNYDDMNSSFDKIIGYIEDILIEPAFQEIQKNFLEKYWKEFDIIDENKLIYMDIFLEYQQTIENYLEDSLKKLLPEFSMKSFITHLSEFKDLDGEVFEILSTFNDFLAFKEMILDYRAMKEGKIEDLSTGILITSVNIMDKNITG
ncbi:ADP-ribosylation factor-like protein 2-binding protein [Chelonus insularis]|uniref:ADP-ribosylation factor-like protein 2-binding protein n=1 Tax=Chelonus insularis TaxID=460826 RepID=UPI0015897683|nr:ADP-ribosylation factor-like protein 2-binding protein [Chelonus insularis]